MARVAGLLAEAGDLPGEDARREAEILLCDALNKPRSYLFAWPEAEVDGAVAERYRRRLAARRDGQPLAYLLGRREFWSLELAVSEATLIPRADTELLVEQALALRLPACLEVDAAETEEPVTVPGAASRPVTKRGSLSIEAAPHGPRVLDLGTGSGAIALALASERPAWRVTGVDVSADALTVARANGTALGLDRVRWRCGSWFEAVAGESFELVVSNPPYVAPGDPHLAQGDLRFEPRSALVAGDNGFAAFDAVIAGSPGHLVQGGWLLFEHGATQGQGVRARLLTAGFESIASHRDLAGRERVTLGRRPVA